MNLPSGGNNLVTFLNGTTAFGADFNQNLGGGGQNEVGETFGLSAFDTNGGFLGAFAFTVAPGAPTFFGASRPNCSWQALTFHGSIRARSSAG